MGLVPALGGAVDALLLMLTPASLHLLGWGARHGLGLDARHAPHALAHRRHDGRSRIWSLRDEPSSRLAAGEMAAHDGDP